MEMPAEPGPGRLAVLLQARPALFCTAAIAAGVLFMIITGIFSTSLLRYLPWKPPTIATALAMGSCLSLLLVGIPWFRVQVDMLAGPPVPGGNGTGGVGGIRSRMGEKAPLYASLALVMAPFLLLDIATGKILRFTKVEPTIAGPVFDIVNFTAEFLLLYLFALILWMLLALALALADAGAGRAEIPVDALSPDGIGGLGNIRSLLRSLITFYFIAMALLVVSYLDPVTVWSREALIVFLLFLAGLLFFFIGMNAIQDIARRTIAAEIGDLNTRIHARYSHLTAIPPGGSDADDERVKKDEAVLEVYYAERERWLALYAKSPVFDARTIAQSAGSLVLPVLAFAVKLPGVAEALFKMLPLAPV